MHTVFMVRDAVRERLRKAQGARLKQARELDGRYETPTEAARALKIPLGTYPSYENGTRGIDAVAPRLAAEFKVHLGWLLTGLGPIRVDDKSRQAIDIGALDADGQRLVLDAYALARMRMERGSR